MVHMGAVTLVGGAFGFLSYLSAETAWQAAIVLGVVTYLTGLASGLVVLSWDAAAHATDMSVVIHEFAHKLDMTNGEADGMPPLHADMDRRAWSEAFRVAYEGFCDAVERSKDTWLDPYAAEAPAEFFAVISEAFFEAPNETRRRYPEVYEQLCSFYRQDPAARLAT
jgi:Mlc titration factor MtfA (ptsG expression regulator)